MLYVEMCTEGLIILTPVSICGSAFMKLNTFRESSENTRMLYLLIVFLQNTNEAPVLKVRVSVFAQVPLVILT